MHCVDFVENALFKSSSLATFADHPVSQEIWSLGNCVAVTQFPRKNRRSATVFPRIYRRSIGNNAAIHIHYLNNSGDVIS